MCAVVVYEQKILNLTAFGGEVDVPYKWVNKALKGLYIVWSGTTDIAFDKMYIKLF